MRSIYRYEVPLLDTVEHELTGDPLYVAVTLREDGLEFWAEFDTEKPVKTRKFVVLGTGHRVLLGMEYRGTGPRTSDGYVWHLYELL